MLYEFSEQTRLGLTYRSQIDIEFKDALTLKNVLPNAPGFISGQLGSVQADLEMFLPAVAILSIYHELDDQWAVMTNMGWQNWSEFGKTNFTFNNLDLKIKDDRDFEDTWSVALGAHYQYSDNWLFMAGLAYDSSPVSDKNRTIDMPLDRQIRYALGAQYEFSKDLSLMVGYELLDAGQGKVSNTGPITGTLEGDFKSNLIHILTFNASWKF